MYCGIGVLMTSPLGLHLFLAYQEFVFFSFCSYYKAFAKLIMESSGTLTRPKSAGTNRTGEWNNISRYDPPIETFHDNLEELNSRAAVRYDPPRNTLDDTSEEYDPPRVDWFHDNLEELIEIMKNMTETFGPFLLQNFSLMLLYWILHIYYMCYVVIAVIRNPSALSIGPNVESLCTQLAGGVLIVR